MGIIGDNSFEPGNLYQIVIEIVITKENITFFNRLCSINFLRLREIMRDNKKSVTQKKYIIRNS